MRSPKPVQKSLNLIYSKSPKTLNKIERKAYDRFFSHNEIKINQNFIDEFVGEERFEELSNEFERKSAQKTDNLDG